MASTELDARIAAFASLADPTRRRLYLYVISRTAGAGREEAAEATGISKALAAFHLDRLIDDGLLVADYRRLSGRTGPGAGRPAKIYRRSSRELSLTIPPRSYEMLARLLAQALTSGEDPGESLRESARAVGSMLGAEARRRAGPRPSRQQLLDAAAEVLDESGFAPCPDADGGGLILGNCPFSPLSSDYVDLVCGANLTLMQGLTEVLDVKDLEAGFERSPQTCCVAMHRARPGAAATRD
ncbi:MAG TPA: transcriptional regulator [Actinomycetota bacterium]|nr:transcriptional regulator [Actinomycetota bacterium]